MKTVLFFLLVLLTITNINGQTNDTIKKETPKSLPEKTALKFNINADGSHFIQATFLNQTWVRFNESNPGTTQFQKNTPTTFDIGLRRTRLQLFGQINDRTFIYFQFGQNNFNNTYNYAATTISTGTNTNIIYANRKNAPFFHDALCELKVTKGNELKIGGGLTIMNGLSRFAQPSISTIMTMDVPVFLQYSVDQIDQFDRRLAIYARGIIKKVDYRIYMSDPFPVGSNGSTPAALSPNATFVNPVVLAKGRGPGINKQFGGYFAYNFFENEAHTTPYMTGTNLGAKKTFNIAFGGVYQKAATWRQKLDNIGVVTDTVYENMWHLSLETFLDMPLNKENGTAINAFAGYYNTNYGKNYLRYNGLMNPATGSIANNLVQTNAYGNAFPMFGTGQVVYTQFGILLSKKLLGEKNGQLMPYLSGQYADYFALQNKTMLVLSGGLNWFIQGHKSKLTLDYQNRPTYYKEGTLIKPGVRKSCVVLQYQIFF
jgi:hypothetical protein